MKTIKIALSLFLFFEQSIFFASLSFVEKNLDVLDVEQRAFGRQESNSELTSAAILKESGLDTRAFGLLEFNPAYFDLLVAQLEAAQGVFVDQSALLVPTEQEGAVGFSSDASKDQESAQGEDDNVDQDEDGDDEPSKSSRRSKGLVRPKPLRKETKRHKWLMEKMNSGWTKYRDLFLKGATFQLLTEKINVSAPQISNFVKEECQHDLKVYLVWHLRHYDSNLKLFRKEHKRTNGFTALKDLILLSQEAKQELLQKALTVEKFKGQEETIRNLLNLR